MRSKKKLWLLFIYMLQLSSCTFGGGYVIIPMMQQRFVEKLGWLDKDEMMDLTAIAQSSPGAIAVNAALLVGWRVGGAAGAFCAALGTALPPLVIISVISVCYAAFIENKTVSLLMAGAQAGVAAVICDLSLNLCLNIKKNRGIVQLALLAVSFIALQFLGANIVVILLCCGVVGVAEGLITLRRSCSK